MTAVEQMRPYARTVSDGLIEFRSNVMYDVVLSRWTYKVWEIMPSDDVEGPPWRLRVPWRLREYWCESDEDGTYVGIGEIFEPKYFGSMLAAMTAMLDEVESYI